MSDSKDHFFEDENGEQVFVPDGTTPEQVADDMSAAEQTKPDPVVHQVADKVYEIDSEQVIIPEGQSIEDVVDAAHEVPDHDGPVSYVNTSVVPDGRRSELFERALADKEQHDADAEDTFGQALATLMAKDPMDAIHSLVDVRTEEDGLRVVAQFDSPEAFRLFQDAIDNGAVNAIQLHTDDSSDQSDRDFQTDLQHLLNYHSMENESGTPDYILAEYLVNQLDAYNQAVRDRAVSRDTPLDRFGRETAPVSNEDVNRVIASVGGTRLTNIQEEQ